MVTLLPIAYAEHPASTPQFIEPITIDPGIFDTAESSPAADSTNKAAEGSYSSTESSYSATTLIWTNGGGDGSASTSSNWSGGIVPHNGDEVLFDGTSSANCTWDLIFPVTLNAFTIASGYTGAVNLTTAQLATAKNHI